VIVGRVEVEELSSGRQRIHQHEPAVCAAIELRRRLHENSKSKQSEYSNAASPDHSGQRLASDIRTTISEPLDRPPLVVRQIGMLKSPSPGAVIHASGSTGTADRV
jgi:hypothetical protein